MKTREVKCESTLSTVDLLILKIASRHRVFQTPNTAHTWHNFVNDMIKHREYYCVTDRLRALLLIQKTVWEIHATSIFIQIEPSVAYIKRELIIVNQLISTHEVRKIRS